MDRASGKRERSEDDDFLERFASESDREIIKQYLERQRVRDAAAAAALAATETRLAEALLDSCLAPLVDRSRKDRSSTKAVGAMVPKQVCSWDVGEEMDMFRRNLSPETLALPAKKMTKPGINPSFKVVHVSQIQTWFLETAGNAVKMLCGLMGDEIGVTASGGHQGTHRDKPDIFFTCEDGPCICGKVESLNLSSNGADLVGRYNGGCNMVCNTVRQTTGYQVKNGTEYGFITNYYHTWITKLTTDGTFWISQAFSKDVQGPKSTLNALLFAVRAGLISKRDNLWTAPTLESVTETVSVAMNQQQQAVGHSAASGGADARHSGAPSVTSSTGISDIVGSNLTLILECRIQAGVDRVTYKGRNAADNAPIAVKCFESREERDSEAAFYRRLASLQGVHIPRCLGEGLLGDGFTSRRFVLILSWVGSDLEGRERLPPVSAWKPAREALLQMHALGVVHGDLAPRNVTYDSGSGRIFFCDFSHARTGATADLAAEDLDSFDRLAAWAAPEDGDSAESAMLGCADGLQIRREHGP